MDRKSFVCLDNFTIKMIAIISMLIDHIGYIFFPEEQLFRAIGRLAFPLFCFLLVEGFHHTRSHIDYLLRLCIFAVLSEIPFDLAFRGALIDWQHQNVFITLALGLISIFCLEEMNNRRVFVLPLILTWAAAYFSHCDYGIGGVLLICMFYVTRETPGVRFILCACILYLFFNPLELYGLLAMLPISLYNGKRGFSLKMVFYWFYPLHLLVLFGISQLF
ncbi:MAG: conjugal transfer protein TraX [Bacteroidales bacterium]|nr:conjugal transfer protein TraX [Clostridium sp.]MCM1203810.1 conjugal transfer protein TraX [Bacteroidales bacterium]